MLVTAAFMVTIYGPITRTAAGAPTLLPLRRWRSDKLNSMDDEQGQHQPAITQPHQRGGKGRDGAGSEHDTHVPETGDAQMKPATTRDEASESGPGDSGAEGGAARKRRRSFWRELPILVVIALALTVIIKVFAIQAFYIPSSSMENTLKIGDRVLVNKIVYHVRDIHRGDVVVFSGLDSWDPTVPQTAPSNPIRRFANWVGSAFGVTAGDKDYVKRVIGLPGDRVACCDAQGRVTVNGVPLNERSYLYPGNAPSLQRFNIAVPPGELWVMGDHRAVSYDSREHRSDPGGGSIPRSKVVGRAFVVVWPLNRLGILSIPATFEQQALAAAAPAGPLFLGFASAIPLTRLQRRVRTRRRRTAGRAAD
jgi:signal peptidase I